MDVIVTIALGVMILVAITQIVLGGIYLVLGDSEAKRQGARKLVIGGALVLLLALLAGLPACAPIAGSAVVTVEPADSASWVPPAWALDPVGQWRNMDWDLWSCPRARGC